MGRNAKVSPREKALAGDIYDIAQEIFYLRKVIKTEHQKEYPMLPNNFWEDIYGRLCNIAFMTDIAVFFPDKDNDCPEYLKKPSREKISLE